jgi:hypothetical protein
MKKSILFITFVLLLILPLLADEIAFQSFENSSSDTWSYTPNPDTNVPYVWGRTDEELGGCTAKDGSYYWGSWLMEDNEVSLTFDNVSLTLGTLHNLSFYYYTKDLDPTDDQLNVTVEYVDEMDNWSKLVFDGQFEFNSKSWSLFSLDIPNTAKAVRLKVLTNYSNPNMDKYVHWDNFSVKTIEDDLSVPIIYNTSVIQRRDGSGLIDISYDLYDANGDLCEVTLLLLDDGDANFSYTPTPIKLSGDIGEDVAPGTGKKVVWNAGAEDMGFDGSQFVLRLKAEDGVNCMPENFIFVEGGSFTRSGYSVTLSSFYIDKYVLTQKGWVEVMGSNPSNWKGDNLPVEYINWYNVIDYCNKRSVKERLTPCYSINGDTSPNDWSSGTIVCDWNANGYRLPTEAEWQYAARGGNQSKGYTFSGSNKINDVGWYGDNSDDKTHPVGEKQSNELGIYDMSGNVWEWCWDWYDSYPSGSQNNPKGPDSGNARVRRGGCYNTNDYYCTVTIRGNFSPSSSDSYLGVRLVRTN